MKFKKHLDLIGEHAFLGASQYHWINYDEDKLTITYSNKLAKQKGTEFHELAAQLIKLNQKLPKSQKTLNMYVNDAIGFKMTPEQPLYYSDNCFGTADAICFRNNVLRIHDLKTGEKQAHMEQLLIYAALFCLEYSISPSDIKIILRIYQNNNIIEYIPQVTDVIKITDKIITFDNIINEIKSQEV